MDDFIERRIIQGLIVSTDYLREISKMWNIKFLQSSSAKLLAKWALDYYQVYDKACGKDIEGIYNTYLPKLDKEKAEDIAEILKGLSEEYERAQFNVP